MSEKKNPVSYDEVFKYLSDMENRYYGDCSDTRKRSIRRFSENVLLEDGILYYDHGKRNKRRWIADQQQQQQILQSLHDNPTGGCHFSRDKTRDKVVSRYFWQGQYEDIDNYVKTCEKCQKVGIVISSLDF